MKPLNPSIERLEERFAPGLVCPVPVDPCAGKGHGSSAQDSKSSKTNSTKDTDSGTCKTNHHSKHHSSHK